MQLDSERFDVAIIIPYFNDDLKMILDSLESNLANEVRKICIICINNGGAEFQISNLNTLSIFQINENKYLSSPYSCRNRGIEFVNANWYIFLDSTCIPASHDWLKLTEGFKAETIYAANVQFYSSDTKTVGDVYDSIINIDNEKTVSERKVAKTACLAVHKTLINKFGMFKEGVRSGGDIEWTRKCTTNGVLIEFRSDWVVNKVSRNSKKLIKKQIRVSSAWPRLWLTKKELSINLIKKVIFCFIPPDPFPLFATAKRRNISLNTSMKVKLIFFGIILRIASAFGILYGLFKRHTK